MKKITLLAVCGILCGYANTGLAVDAITWGPGTTFDGCYSWDCREPDEWYGGASPTSRNCADYTAMCVYLSGKVTGVASCMTCNPGYEMVQGINVGITACSASGNPNEDHGGVESYTYTYCKKNCNSTTCASTGWAAKGTGYQTRIYRSCSATGTSGTCNSSTQYQCAAGYYGTTTNGTSGCTQCPTWTGVYTTSGKTTLVRGTSNAGATAITGCYVAAGTYYDTSGTFKTTGNCNYAS
ncbi:MAG: hypothetical protein K2M34_04375 [Alphaproteobacteria bacterium]|nr:hypothetical protein [Alphaproteobacteria bacterium]